MVEEGWKRRSHRGQVACLEDCVFQSGPQDVQADTLGSILEFVIESGLEVHI